jgi:hypothetical protein
MLQIHCRPRGEVEFQPCQRDLKPGQRRSKAQAASHRLLTADARVQSLASRCGTYGQTGTMTGLSASSVCYPCQYHSNFAPYSFTNLITDAT